MITKLKYRGLGTTFLIVVLALSTVACHKVTVVNTPPGVSANEV